ncbi:MAG: hypothetical protein FD124_1928 [Alphaproteobacteria bacterium]|nr:MAG: hypothetical protein FD160_693 [Caulobacteraceae bacterium]TPW05960.1 MAG: hypothetical protein FD124_1928 [Alphaproteobacteria bacterium]
MPDFRRVTDDFYVAPQIEEADVRAAAAAGFRTLVNNRPDGEQPGQLPSIASERASVEAGLDFRAIPVSGDSTPQAVAAMQAVLQDAPRPVLAYCRSGTRSVKLWAMASVKSGAVSPEAAIEAARGAGYDLGPMAATLRALRNA